MRMIRPHFKNNPGGASVRVLGMRTFLLNINVEHSDFLLFSYPTSATP